MGAPLIKLPTIRLTRDELMAAIAGHLAGLDGITSGDVFRLSAELRIERDSVRFMRTELRKVTSSAGPRVKMTGLTGFLRSLQVGQEEICPVEWRPALYVAADRLKIKVSTRKASGVGKIAVLRTE